MFQMLCKWPGRCEDKHKTRHKTGTCSQGSRGQSESFSFPWILHYSFYTVPLSFSYTLIHCLWNLGEKTKWLMTLGKSLPKTISWHSKGNTVSPAYSLRTPSLDLQRENAKTFCHWSSRFFLKTCLMVTLRDVSIFLKKWEWGNIQFTQPCNKKTNPQWSSFFHCFLFAALWNTK